MPRPTLTHNQNGLAKEILKMARLDYVIKMPTRLFAEQKRTVNTAIFGFTKTKHHENDDVLYYDMEDDGHVSVQHKGRIDKEKKWAGIENMVLDAVNNKKELPSFCEKRKLYLGDVLNFAGIRSQRESNYEMVKITDLFDVEKGSLASEESRDGEYNFITASEEWKKHDSFEYDQEAIVYAVSASGSLGRSHYINGKFIASNLCLVLTPKKQKIYKVDLQFYNCYFEAIRRAIVSDLADGTSKLTIRKEDFEGYYVEYVPLKKQIVFVKNNLAKVTKMREDLKLEIERIETSIRKIF